MTPQLTAKTESTAMRQWFKMVAKDGKADISIYDEIGPSYFGEASVSAKDFKAELDKLSGITAIDLHVNSPGGSVMDGVAIHNLLKEHPAKVTAYIDGIAASAASYVVMAADKIIAPANTFMLVHEPATVAWGTQDDLLSAAADLERMTGSFSATYAKRSGQTAEAVAALMKEDRLMTAAEAKELGYVDEVSADIQMAATYRPEALARLSDKARATFKAALDKAKPAAEPAAAAAAAAEADPAAEPGKEAKVAAEGGNVISLADARKGHVSMEHVKEVRDLCKLAGMPNMAADFIAEGTALAEVRTKLTAARAAAEEGTEVTGAHQGAGKGSATKADPVAIKKGWGAACANVNARQGFPSAAE